MSRIPVRGFRNGDESAIVELFNNVYGKYGGVVPRTVEYWTWCCLERPDVKRDGILLTFNEKQLCGYVVAGLSGHIWEMCVRNDNTAVIRALLHAAVSYLENAGVPSVSVNVPRNTGATEILREAGFSQAPAGGMFVTTLSPARFVHALATPQREVLVKQFDEEFSFQLHKVPFGVAKNFYVKIHAAAVEVSEGLTPEPAIVVELELADLVSVLFGDVNATRLLVTGKMRVKPLWKFRRVLKLLSTLRLHGPWFFPLSDLI